MNFTEGKREKANIYKLSGALDAVVKSLGLSKKYYGWLVVSNWPIIAGEQVAKVSKATRFNEGVLYIAVEDSAWRQELSMQSKSIMESIRRQPYGKVVNQLRFVKGEKG